MAPGRQRRGVGPTGLPSSPLPGALARPGGPPARPYWSRSSRGGNDALAVGRPRLASGPLLLNSLQARAGLVVVPLASLAIAVTHWLNGVPFWPAMCFLLSSLQ